MATVKTAQREQFTPNYDALYDLTYADGKTKDLVEGVRRRDEERGLVIEIAYPFGHGAGLLVKKIVAESKDAITFEVGNPQISLLEGTVTIKLAPG